MDSFFKSMASLISVQLAKVFRSFWDKICMYIELISRVCSVINAVQCCQSTLRI